MEFKIVPNKHRARGSTLIELMLGSTIAVMVLTGILSGSLYTARSFALISSKTELDQKSRITLDKLANTIHQAKAVSEYSSTNVTLMDANGAKLQIWFDPQLQRIVRTQEGKAETVMRSCNRFAMTFFTGRLVAGSSELERATNAASIRVIELNYTTSTAPIGTKEYSVAKTARVALRTQSPIL